MFKTEIITFRTSREVRKFLEQAGQESQCSRSSLIEQILRDSLNVPRKGITPEEHRGTKKVHDWSVQREEDGEDLKILMLGGVRIALPKEMLVKVSFDEEEAAFQIELASGDTIKIAAQRPGSNETSPRVGLNLEDVHIEKSASETA